MSRPTEILLFGWRCSSTWLSILVSSTSASFSVSDGALKKQPTIACQGIGTSGYDGAELAAVLLYMASPALTHGSSLGVPVPQTVPRTTQGTCLMRHVPWS